MPNISRKRKFKKKISNNKIIIIVVIIVVLFLLISAGIGLYFYLTNKSNKINKTTQEEIYEPKIVDLPNIFYKNTVPLCDITSCLKIGEKILLNQLLTSTSKINNIIIKKTLNQEEMNAKQKIFGEDTIVNQEERPLYSDYYLLLYNTFANVYRYINLSGNNCKLVSNGLLCNNKIIKFIGFKCTINNKNYYCDLTYYSTKKYVILCDDNAIPIGIISNYDFNYLNNNNKVQKYLLDNITTILVTNYSILVLNSNYKLIGLLSIL